MIKHTFSNIFSTHGIQTLNVYETLHSLYTKRCSLAVYETLVTVSRIDILNPNQDYPSYSLSIQIKRNCIVNRF